MPGAPTAPSPSPGVKATSDVYRHASDAFRSLHAVATEDDTRFTDHMLFTITIGVR